MNHIRKRHSQLQILTGHLASDLTSHGGNQTGGGTAFYAKMGLGSAKITLGQTAGVAIKGVAII